MNLQLLYPVNSVQQRMMMNHYNLLLIIPLLIQTIMVHAVHVYYNITCIYFYIYNVAPSRDTLYSGMMYYEKKEVSHWKTMYSVVRDLEVLKRVMYT